MSIYLTLTSSSRIFPLSMTVKEPMPGSIKDFKISVPRAVALIRQTWAVSNANCP